MRVWVRDAARGVKIAGHRGSLAGSSNQVEFYPDLGYVMVVLGTQTPAPKPSPRTSVASLHLHGGSLCRHGSESPIRGGGIGND